MVAAEDCVVKPSFSLLPGPATRQRTRYESAPETSSQSTDTFSEPASVPGCNPEGLPGTAITGGAFAGVLALAFVASISGDAATSRQANAVPPTALARALTALKGLQCGDRPRS